MRDLFGPSLWPQGTRDPLRRMMRGMIVSPIVVGLAISVSRMAIVIVNGRSGTDLYDAAIATIENSMLTAFGFAFTFGLVGVAALWALGLRNAAIWAATGGALGAAAAYLTGSGGPEELAAGGLLGWAILAVTRWQAGIRD